MPQPRDITTRTPKPVRPNPDTDYPAPTGVSPGESSPDETEPTKEEQAFYEQLTIKARQIVHGEMRDKILARMNNPKEPVHENVGQVAGLIGRMLIGQAKASGKEVYPEAVLAAGIDMLVPELFELGEAAKIFPKMSEEQEQDEMEMAIYSAEKYYGEAEIAAGTSPQAEAQAYMEQKLQTEGSDVTLENMMDQAGVAPSKPSALAAGVQQANRSLV